MAVPVTVEGCAYSQIYEAVSKTKEIIESIKKFGKEFETIEYPEETLHEIITNAFYIEIIALQRIFKSEYLIIV